MLELCQGNIYKLVISVKHADGTIKSLVGTTELKYQLASRTTTTPLISFVLTDDELTIVDPINGIVHILISSEVLNTIKNGTYHHELWQVNSTGSPTTLMSERVSICSRLIKD